jgi:hypothetical protein
MMWSVRNMRISWANFKRRLGALSDKALTEPLANTRNGRDRRVVRLEDFTAEEMALIAKADVPAEHAHLDAELKD